MARKIVLIADPGIDTAFAIALALHDPNLDVVGIIPTAGNVNAEQATANVQILIDQFDPAKWPRVASALPTVYETDGTSLHGPGGLGGLSFPSSSRHQLPAADKALVELIRQYPHEITIVVLGPITTLAQALLRDPELQLFIDRVIFVGGAYREPGNAGPMSEFHIWLDPEGARRVIQVCQSLAMIPLDVTRRLILSPSELLSLPNPESKTCQFLRSVIPFGIRASSNLYGIEGFHIKDVLGVAAAALPGSVTTEPKTIDVETKGQVTRGMTVIDDRGLSNTVPNVQLATNAAIGEIRQWIEHVLKSAP